MWTYAFIFVQEWETVEKTLPDGTKKRVRRRIIVVKVVKKPKVNDDEKAPTEEEPVQYEEDDIDEANPEDDKYDPKVILNYLFFVIFS